MLAEPTAQSTSHLFRMGSCKCACVTVQLCDFCRFMLAVRSVQPVLPSLCPLGAVFPQRCSLLPTPNSGQPLICSLLPRFCYFQAGFHGSA